MPGTTTTTKNKWSSHIGYRILVFLVFLVSGNLLAGYVAVKLDYPSLFNIDPSFWGYAIPLPFSWGLAHLPSMFIFGIPLLFLPVLPDKYTRYFRITCICTFCILLLELDNKIPLLLYPKLDALVALIFSFIIIPPSRQDNPKQVAAFKLTALLSIFVLGYFGYSVWTHRTPQLSNKQYVNGLFELNSINIDKNYRKKMEFKVTLKKDLQEDQACTSGQKLASELLRDYEFDKTYNKIVTVVFNLTSQKENFAAYEIGEISLNNAHKTKNGRFACYLRYRKD